MRRRAGASLFSLMLLVTLYAADHNPYEESHDVFTGNGGTVDTNGIAWEFLSRFSKDIDLNGTSSSTRA